MVRKKQDGPSVDDQRDIFCHLIRDTYNVGCIKGPKQAFSLDRRFVDTYGVFYPKETLCDGRLISERWKQLGKTWDLDYSNPYVQMWIGVKYDE